MVTAISRSLAVQSVSQTINPNAMTSVAPASLQTGPASSVKAAAPDLRALTALDQLRGGGTVVSNSPGSFAATAERPDIVNASASVISQIGDDAGPSAHLGVETGLPRDSRFEDPDADLEDPKAGLPQIGGFDPEHDLNIPGGDAATTPGSIFVSCAVGAAAGAKAGPWGAAAGCVVGVATGAQQDLAADAIDAFIEWIAGSASPKQDVTTVPMGTPHDMGAPADPKSDPNPEADVQGGRPLKFASPELNWLNPLKGKPDGGDPFGVEKDESSNVLRFFGQAVDPNPDADSANDGAAMRAILSTSWAVTDPFPDSGAALMLRMGTLRG